MPNLPSLYTKLTRSLREEDKVEKPVEVDAGREEALAQWRRATITQEKVKEMNDECSRLFNECLHLAKTYHQHEDHQQILNNLIRIDTLNTIIQSYV